MLYCPELLQHGAFALEGDFFDNVSVKASVVEQSCFPYLPAQMHNFSIKAKETREKRKVYFDFSSTYISC